jgi:transglutaminase-like putative cysteine protease
MSGPMGSQIGSQVSNQSGANAGGAASNQSGTQSSTQSSSQSGSAPDDREIIVEHDTEYTYSTQVVFAQHLAHLTPLSAAGQSVRDFQLEIEPPPTLRHSGIDAFGNERTYFAFNVAHEGLRVQTRSRVRVAARFEAVEPRESSPWEDVRDSLRYVAGAPFIPATEFVFSSAFVPYDAALRDYAQASFGHRQTVLAGALDLMHRVHADFRYDTTSTDVSTPTREAFAARAGVCQDFTHVMIGGLRALGLPARYVSGYLYTGAPPSRALPASVGGAPSRTQSASQAQGTPMIGADASHAWISVWCPRFGWVELDPTNDVVPGTGHVRLAVGRDYGDVAPLRGVVQGGGDHRLRVAVRLSAATA